jgi:hypothetical protein
LLVVVTMAKVQQGLEVTLKEVQLMCPPLTFGKVFQAIPRMTKAINTPIINIRIAQAFGLPNIGSSSEFKKIYSDGREALRLVNAS